MAVVAQSHENLGFHEAVEATKNLYLRDLPEHVAVGPLPGKWDGFNPSMLPIDELDIESLNTLKHFFDIILDYDGATTHEQLTPIFASRDWSLLPAPFSPAQLPTFVYKMQLFLVPQVDGRTCIVKHFYIPSNEDKIFASAAVSLIRGVGYGVRWGAVNEQLARKALQFMLEQLPGMQYRCFVLSAEKKAANKAHIKKPARRPLMQVSNISWNAASWTKVT